MIKKTLFMLLCLSSSAAFAETATSDQSTGSTAYSYSAGDFGFQAGFGAVTAKGSLWGSEQRQAFRFGFDLMKLKSDKASVGTRLEFAHFKSPYEFAAGVKKDAKVSLHTLRVQACLKVWEMHHPCISMIPTNATIASGNNQRTMGLDGVGLGWETVFDNGMYLRADGETLQAVERRAGSRTITTMNSAWLSLGAKFPTK